MYLSINHSIYLCICLSASLKRKLFCETLELDNVKNEASLRDFFSFWTWKRQKWKTKQVCETSSIFALDNIKNEGILGNFLNFRSWQYQKRNNSVRLLSIIESWVQSWRPRTNAFCNFSSPVHVSKVLRMPRKSEARPHEVLHQSHKIILANLKVWCSKMQPLWRNQRSDLLTSLLAMSLVLGLPCELHLCRSASNVSRLPTFLKLSQNLICGSGGSKSRLAKLKRRGAIWPDERWKVACRCGAKRVSKSKCTKRLVFGAGLAFKISKLCTPLWREAHFQVKMYKAHQRRSTFGSCDVEKVHEAEGAKHIWKSNCYTTCSRHFWTLKPRFVWQAQGILHPAKIEKSLEKHSVSRLFDLFAHMHLLSSDSFSSLIFFWLFPPLLFHLPILSDVWLLNFLRWFFTFRYIWIYAYTPICMWCSWTWDSERQQPRKRSSWEMTNCSNALRTRELSLFLLDTK